MTIEELAKIVERNGGKIDALGNKVGSLDSKVTALDVKVGVFREEHRRDFKILAEKIGMVDEKLDSHLAESH